jgi:transcription elongation factor Elf1
LNRENKIKAYSKGYYRTHSSESFVCKSCGRLNVSHGAGSGHRNHCSNCLTSMHLDIEPGDREADCGGLMEAIGVWVKKDGEWAVIHRCKRCGHLSSNRVAADDNPLKLMSVALRPMSNPPFPLERIEELAANMGGDGKLA